MEKRLPGKTQLNPHGHYLAKEVVGFEILVEGYPVQPAIVKIYKLHVVIIDELESSAYL